MNDARKAAEEHARKCLKTKPHCYEGPSLVASDLSRANLVGGYFVGVDFSGALLSYADLSLANLSQTDCSNVDFSSANLSFAKCHEADFTDSMLVDANLTKCDFTEARFLRTHFKGAIIRHTILTATHIADSDIHTITKIATLCFGGWPVTVRERNTTIGCVTSSNEQWLSYPPQGCREIFEMDVKATEWWIKYSTAVCAVIRAVEDGCN